MIFLTLFFQVLGPKNVGLTLLIPLTFLYVGIFITGVVGNVAVCLVIVKNKSMHTATNYYLFSLAISDLMILVLGRFPASLVISFARLITEGNRQLNQSYFWEGFLETLVDAITESGVHVPTTVGKGHKPHACLDQPPGQ